MAKIWAMNVGTTLFTTLVTKESIGLNADIAGSASEAKSVCSMELIEDSGGNYYNLKVTYDACIPYIENTSMGPVARCWVFEGETATINNVVSTACNDKMVPTIEAGTPTSTVEHITVIAENQLSVNFDFGCEINHISDEGVLNVLTAED